LGVDDWLIDWEDDELPVDDVPFCVLESPPPSTTTTCVPEGGAGAAVAGGGPPDELPALTGAGCADGAGLGGTGVVCAAVAAWRTPA
jgi:hypothetical protein